VVASIKWAVYLSTPSTPLESPRVDSYSERGGTMISSPEDESWASIVLLSSTVNVLDNLLSLLKPLEETKVP